MKDLTEFKLGNIIFVYNYNFRTAGIGVCVQETEESLESGFLVNMNGGNGGIVYASQFDKRDSVWHWERTRDDLVNAVIMNALMASGESLAKTFGWSEDDPTLEEIRGL